MTFEAEKDLGNQPSIKIFIKPNSYYSNVGVLPAQNIRAVALAVTVVHVCTLSVLVTETPDNITSRHRGVFNTTNLTTKHPPKCLYIRWEGGS